jgi:hypothetical protein
MESSSCQSRAQRVMTSEHDITIKCSDGYQCTSLQSKADAFGTLAAINRLASVRVCEFIGNSLWH